MGNNTYFQKIGGTLRRSDIINRKPLVEILGDYRVLIENYLQVLKYEPQRIEVSVSFGKLCIDGTGMVLLQMSCEQLVISGKIDSVSLFRGE